MREDERIWAVKELLFDYVKSLSLRHIRDPHSLIRLAQEIVKRIDRANSIWRKWDGQREVVLKSALCCWIPVEDMRDFLNRMPGPPLTATDVAQRLKAFEEEEHYAYPKEELQTGCLALYEKEKAAGTELPAIVQLLRDHVLLAVSRHWIKVSDDQLKPLADLTRRLAVKKTGLTDKNRERLRQFDHRANLDALLALPYRVLREVKRTDSRKRRDALRVMLALAVEILIMVPIRIKNLTSLEINRHLVRMRLGADAVIHLVIPEDEIKNGVPCEMELPTESAELFAVYRDTYRPRLCDIPSPWLFPSDKGQRRVATRFATQICAFIQEETGVKMNVHLFRHFAMKLHLDAHPEDVETGRRVLGHKALTTTLRYYADLRSPAAYRRYDAMITRLRKATPSTPARRGAGSRRHEPGV